MTSTEHASIKVGTAYVTFRKKHVDISTDKAYKVDIVDKVQVGFKDNAGDFRYLGKDNQMTEDATLHHATHLYHCLGDTVTPVIWHGDLPAHGLKYISFIEPKYSGLKTIAVFSQHLAVLVPEKEPLKIQGHTTTVDCDSVTITYDSHRFSLEFLIMLSRTTAVKEYRFANGAHLDQLEIASMIAEIQAVTSK